MKYVSLFSGIGGLEHATHKPLFYCESDGHCAEYLRKQHPGLDVFSDVADLRSIQCEAVAGGWPCQDISVAGKRAGLGGQRSSLFYRMTSYAVECGADSLVAENVPNLLTMNGGRDFQEVVDHLADSGFSHVAWRVLNSREFRLPQERRRLFIVASRCSRVARSLHRPIVESDFFGQPSWLPLEKASPADSHRNPVNAFYWTGGGKMSLCLSTDYAPTLKVGAEKAYGRSTIAVWTNHTVRKLSAKEYAVLQGFDPESFEGFAASLIVRMAGNAVSKPAGNFVMACLDSENETPITKTGFFDFSESGILEDGIPWNVQHRPCFPDVLLGDFLIKGEGVSLSAQAAAGLLLRIVENDRPIPRGLYDSLLKLTQTGDQRIHGTRAKTDSVTRLRQVMSEGIRPVFLEEAEGRK